MYMPNMKTDTLVPLCLNISPFYRVLQIRGEVYNGNPYNGRFYVIKSQKKIEKMRVFLLNVG